MEMKTLIYLGVALMLPLMEAQNHQHHQYFLLPAHEVQQRYQQQAANEQQQQQQQQQNALNYNIPQQQSAYGGYGHPPQNQVVYLQRHPDVHPAYLQSIYNYAAHNRGQSPPNLSPSSSPEAPSNNLPTAQIPSSQDEGSPNKNDDQPAKIEIEPDAELLPGFVEMRSNNPEPPPRPQIPIVPFGGGQPIAPGHRFYIYTTTPQFYGGNPSIGYPPVNTFYRFPQATHGYPQRFLIFGQSPDGQTVLVQPQNNGAFLVGARSGNNYAASQRLHVPPLAPPALDSQIGARSQDTSYPEEQTTFENTRYGYVAQPFSKDEKTTNNKEAELNNQNQNYAYAVPGRFPNQPVDQTLNGNNYLAYTRFLQQTNQGASENEKLFDSDDKDSISVEAAKEEKKEVKKKVELSHPDLKAIPAEAEASAHGIALTGKGGTARSSPTSTAIVGPEGTALSNPIATALAGTFDQKVKPSQLKPLPVN